MPLDNRDYYRGEHPPACTCVECTNRRLSRVRNGQWEKQQEYRGSSGHVSGISGCLVLGIVLLVLLVLLIVVVVLYSTGYLSFL